MPQESRIVVGMPGALGETGSVFVYGDHDDPARLVALLADRVLAVVEPTSVAAKKAHTCLAPRTAWKQRLKELRAALDDAARVCDEPLVVLWDVDALASERLENWDQERTSLLRRDLFRVVRDAASTGGWILVRTARADGSERASLVDDLDLERATGVPAHGSLPEEARLFAPDCWAIAAFLVGRDVVRPRDLIEIHRTVEAADDHLVDLAYEALDGTARDAAALLTALRAPQSVNGHFGRTAFDPDARGVSADVVPASTRAVLIDAGLIQPTWPGGPWRIPRVVRKRLAQLAQLMVAKEVDRLHRREAVPERSSANALVEAHYHAICTGDVELAKHTAVYYGSELSDVARQLSMSAKDLDDGAAQRRQFTEAAELFHHVVTEFDPTDAYAWEYYGYNLALAESDDTEEIFHAYQAAYELRRANPLYHGRLLGFRGQLGQPIVEEAVASLRGYAVEPPERESVSFFAEAVLGGLWRGAQRQQARELIAACRPLLASLAPRALQKASWAK